VISQFINFYYKSNLTS